MSERTNVHLTVHYVSIFHVYKLTIKRFYNVLGGRAPALLSMTSTYKSTEYHLLELTTQNLNFSNMTPTLKDGIRNPESGIVEIENDDRKKTLHNVESKISGKNEMLLMLLLIFFALLQSCKTKQPATVRSSCIAELQMLQPGYAKGGLIVIQSGLVIFRVDRISQPLMTIDQPGSDKSVVLAKLFRVDW